MAQVGKLESQTDESSSSNAKFKQWVSEETSIPLGDVKGGDNIPMNVNMENPGVVASSSKLLVNWVAEY